MIPSNRAVKLCVVNSRPSTSGFRAGYHRHPFHELGFVLEGTCSWHFRSRRPISLRSGEAIIVPANHLHRELTPRPVTLGWIGFEADASFERDLCYRAIPLQDEAEDLHALLRRIARRQGLGGNEDLEASSLALQLMLLIIRQVATRPPPDALAPTLNPRQTGTVTSVAAYLSRNISQPLTLNEVARYHNLSAPHLSQLFHQFYGVTPTAYRLKKRIEHASALLQDSRLSIKEIAAASGFADVAHFGKEFKRRTGQTPGAVRAAQT